MMATRHEQVDVLRRSERRSARDHRDPLDRARAGARRHPVLALRRRGRRARRRAAPLGGDDDEGRGRRAAPGRRQDGRALGRPARGAATRRVPRRRSGRWIDASAAATSRPKTSVRRQRDMDGIARETPWVTGVDPARGGSGDPSPVTALGVLHGMRAACDARVRVARARGAAGSSCKARATSVPHLARLLVDAGARVAIADVDAEKVARRRRSCRARAPDRST